jgi:hypothetical protein
MLQISKIDKKTSDIICLIAQHAGGGVEQMADEPKKQSKVFVDKLNLSDSYTKEQKKSINKRWNKIEATYLNAK